ncbi:coiled-coil domain-containing protein 125 isoform X2 [Pristis pectinata]|uniref:coiled-coil domain-containing protein 125 isoform X2 n=1 Tax=Pristis pectinata TaxID=685728 RepID=UPI00223D407B|nr:coiled-coil domain-containing protein 125 isoform X2 [Pristis pectinata]
MSDQHGVPKEKVKEEDDMLSGDLGDGFRRKPGGIYDQKHCSVADTARSRQGSDCNGDAFGRSVNKDEKNEIPCLCWTKNGSIYGSFHQLSTSDVMSIRRQSSNAEVEMSNEELKLRLQEVMQEAELLRSELEVTQQQLEGKYEALKILQDMAVLDKATVHTKTLLQKTGERNKILEKEVNILQWENDFKQDKFKHLEQFWVERLERTCIENTELAKKLEARDGEIRDLKSENTLLSQQCSELLAMLNIKDQHTFEKMLPANMNGFTEITALELGVLGACHCNGIGAEPCGCARMAAATRRQLLGLQQEIDLQRKREEEAHLMADAFRSAFEHQLKRTNDQTLRITEVGKLHRKYLKKGLVWTQSKGDPAYKTEVNHITLGQRLKGLFNSSADYKKLEVLDDPQEVLRMLIDLLNDKEEALAHQRKVSYMLARTIEEQDHNNSKKDTPTIDGSKVLQCQRRSQEFKNISCPSVDQSVKEHRTVLRTYSFPPSYFTER